MISWSRFLNFSFCLSSSSSRWSIIYATICCCSTSCCCTNSWSLSSEPLTCNNSHKKISLTACVRSWPRLGSSERVWCCFLDCSAVRERSRRRCLIMRAIDLVVTTHGIFCNTSSKSSRSSIITSNIASKSVVVSHSCAKNARIWSYSWLRSGDSFFWSQACTSLRSCVVSALFSIREICVSSHFISWWEESTTDCSNCCFFWDISCWSSCWLLAWFFSEWKIVSWSVDSCWVTGCSWPFFTDSLKTNKVINPPHPPLLKEGTDAF